MGFIKQTFRTARQAQLWKNYIRAETESSKEMAKNALLKSIGNDKGLTMKIGQFLASHSSDQELKSTVYNNNSPAYSFKKIQPLLEEEIGGDISSLFISFQEEAETASLGQVHKAQLKSGEVVAVKIQYPGIREEIENQVRLFGLTPNIGPSKKWGIPLSSYKNTISNLLKSEVQYDIEADFGKNIYTLFKDHPHIETPFFYSELSSDWVLVQSWMDGEPLNHLQDLSTEQRRDFADLLVEFYFLLMAKGGVVQSDFHRGNFKIKTNENQKITLQALDFGAVRVVTHKMVQGLVNLVCHGGMASQADPITLLTEVGFDPEKLKHIAPQCGEIVRLIAEPFSGVHRYDIKNWKLFDRIKVVLGEDHWWFRSAGDPEFLLVMRSFQGLLGILNELNMPVSFKDLLIKSAPDQWANSLKSKISKSHIEAPQLNTLATRLHVQVTEGCVEKANMSLAITCIYDLKHLLDLETQKKIKEQGIDLDKLVHDFLKKGGTPGRLFEASYSGKKIKVWAE